MKVLLYEWNNYMVEAVDDICAANHLEVDRFNWKLKQDYYDEEFLNWFAKNVTANTYDFVLSINYYPMIAIACNRMGYKYVSWCCDCPFNITNPEETLGLETNYCFVFDYNQYVGYKSQGIDTVYHLPLGAHAKKARNFVYKESMTKKYASDISLVGVLYESQLPIIMSLLNDDTKNIITELVHNQEELYNYNLFRECITDELIDYMNAQYSKGLEGTGRSFEVNKKALEFALSCETTRRNRIVLLNLFAKRYKTKLYSYQTFDLLKDVEQCGTVDYVREMPYVFKYSKINLNPSLRCIETGIPLRAFDIMGFGGLLMSNYQQELADLYIDGEEVVLYDSYADAMEKTEFYLKNDDLREKIAINGQKKTLENHTLELAFEKILKTIDA